MRDDEGQIEKKLDRITAELRWMRLVAIVWFLIYYLEIDRLFVWLVVGVGAAGTLVFQLVRFIIDGYNRSRLERARRELELLAVRMNRGRGEPLP
jgi:UPF0716 family protein affecting phage T7 exclusion